MGSGEEKGGFEFEREYRARGDSSQNTWNEPDRSM